MKVLKNKLKLIVDNFNEKKILVVGDLILDHYIFGKVDRVSPEAPVPVVWANNEKFFCGGAANVGRNIVSLGAEVSLCGVIGNDNFGKRLRSLIKQNNINDKFVIDDKTRPTTIKTRILAQHQQMLRLDWESVEFLSEKINDKILKLIENEIKNYDAVIIEDYGKGVINPTLVGEIVALCNEKNKIVTVDPKEEHFQYYKNVTALTPNLAEAQAMAQFKIRSKDQLPILADAIIKKLNPKALLITLGEDGMMLFSEKITKHIPTTALEVFDVTGAGDTVIAVFTLALTAGASFLEAAIISNFAAGIVVGKLGAATTNKQELIKRINESNLI
ncbi:MAG: D-glycero-beta-D-manno-heptose-7-phosphate kinase [Candidatus Omnitrophica bacterium]|nr:D-glycero-beta-D-manno-heptose-7-phosphate kinase [Candidatus Omnitrophota bacterium]